MVYATLPHVSATERLNELMHEDVGKPKGGVLESDIYVLSHRLERRNFPRCHCSLLHCKMFHYVSTIEHIFGQVILTQYCFGQPVELVA